MSVLPIQIIVILASAESLTHGSVKPDSSELMKIKGRSSIVRFMVTVMS